MSGDMPSLPGEIDRGGSSSSDLSLQLRETLKENGRLREELDVERQRRRITEKSLESAAMALSRILSIFDRKVQPKYRLTFCREVAKLEIEKLEKGGFAVPSRDASKTKAA
jgi:hypothetical protein